MPELMEFRVMHAPSLEKAPYQSLFLNVGMVTYHDTSNESQLCTVGYISDLTEIYND